MDWIYPYGNCRLINTVGRAPVCWAGGLGFEPPYTLYKPYIHLTYTLYIPIYTFYTPIYTFYTPYKNRYTRYIHFIYTHIHLIHTHILLIYTYIHVICTHIHLMYILYTPFILLNVSGSLNNWKESAAFVMTSRNGCTSYFSRIKTSPVSQHLHLSGSCGM